MSLRGTGAYGMSQRKGPASITLENINIKYYLKVSILITCIDNCGDQVRFDQSVIVRHTEITKNITMTFSYSFSQFSCLYFIKHLFFS